MKHHATLYISQDFSLEILPEEIRTPGTDVEHVFIDAFGIGDARALSQQATVRPLTNKVRAFVLRTNTITTEAQNALLKLFEDPPQTSVFYVSLPRESILLPTLRSRLQLDHLADQGIDTADESFSDFLSLSYADRLTVVGEKTKKKDTHWIDSMHTGLQQYCSKITSNTARETQELIFIDTNLRRRGGSKKMLLEALALTLPLSHAP